MGRFAILFGKKAKSALRASEIQQDYQSPEVKCVETGSSRAEPGTLGIDAIDVMAQTIMRECTAWGMLSVDGKDALGGDTGICIRSKYGSIRSCPPERPGLEAFEAAVLSMNTKVALKMRSKSVEVAVRHHIDVAPELLELQLDANTRIQIMPSIEDLPLARKSQYAAFVREEDIIPMARSLEAALVKFLWSDEADQLNEKTIDSTSSVSPSSPELNSSEMVLPEISGDSEDPEKAAILAARRLRPVALIAPVATGCAAATAIILLSLGIRAPLIRWIYDGNAMRFALVAVLPLIFFVVMFPASVIISSALHLLGPVAQFHQNSANYSALKPPRDASISLLPITIQMPVYKESLEEVLIPTLESVQRATTVYERQGGIVNVIVCDDGLQLLSEADRARRVKYYRDHNVAYVARPPDGVDGFQRRGRFKKAGNLNHCNSLSLRIEDIRDEMRQWPQNAAEAAMDPWTEFDERNLYDSAFAKALDEHGGKTCAEGNVILLIDSDTRVPEDCFMDASMEMTQSPHVAIIQHSSGVMQVAHHFFENGVAFFTRNLQIGISFTAASGDGAPFVGHNAFLRWRALQECALPDPYDGIARIWSESHVSEDFQISLRLQSLGWTLRWATYSNNGFEEGVSLTCSDELARWQKYAYGCSEIIFNPIRYWPTRSPLTKLFRTFLASNIPPHAKYGIMGYIFSYYAISLACTASLANYVLIGVFAISDSFYCTSWNILFVCLLLCQGVTNLVMCILRYRLKLEHAGKDAIAQVKWIPHHSSVLRGILRWTVLAHHTVLHKSPVLDEHESVVKSNFFLQMPRIWRRFWIQIVLSVAVLAGLIVSTTSLTPAAYRVVTIEAIVPLALTYAFHLIWPFVLDTDITTFTF
ncbi:hypothetical protein EHS25_008916 [Saitozyma podzolica]|uniref:Uncharacterized protein n=1 Tax=Saitozyma podzolica TaxID=1890683 RepID=A0A427YN72_9TREE|nr:hypothetical protein EHS25_008916 [Saitozyma podzolica]